jgi:hypothetical protein
MNSSAAVFSQSDQHDRSSLVLLCRAAGTSLWTDPTNGLRKELEARLPGVHVLTAGTHDRRELESALAASAFLGASTAVVVSLWDRHGGDPAADDLGAAARWLDVTLCDAPPEADAIAAAYHSATLGLTGGRSLRPCA